MPYDKLASEFRPGDWIYLDNGNEAGHSVLFVDWDGADKKTTDTPTELGGEDVAAAVAANKKHFTKLDPAAVKAKLTSLVQGLTAGMKDKRRGADSVGRVSGQGFSAPQQKVVDGILAGGSDVETDIANLVALGQKLSVINVISGDPTRPNGKLDQKIYNGGTWTPPMPAWASDGSLKRQAPAP